MRIVTCAQMREAERTAVDSGITSLRLMENAGSAAARFIRDTLSVQGVNVIVLCGRGNNGGDGFVVARKLLDAGAVVKIILTSGAPSTQNAIEMFERARGLSISVYDFGFQQQECIRMIANCAILVDAIFGTGFRGAVDKGLEPLFDSVNNSSAKIFSLDMPSGANADTGVVAGSCIKADYTITFAAPKTGQFTFPAADYCGSVKAVNIGMPDNVFRPDGSEVELLDIKMVKDSIPKRKRDSNKGTYGKLFCLCGSLGMSGAAYLSAAAALRCGAGLVVSAVPKSIYTPLAAKLNEAMVYPFDETADGTFSYSNLERIIEISQSAGAMLIGCGLSQNEETKNLVRDVVKNAQCPIVLDADGINSYDGHIDLLRESGSELILTPHPGEMARLIGKSIAEIQEDRLNMALSIAGEYGVTVVLKGAYTVVATKEGRAFINPTGNPGMAKGGSGDILAGMTAAFLTQGFSSEKAACCSVFLHGLAGDRCAEKMSQYGMAPSDMLTEIPQIFRELSR